MNATVAKHPKQVVVGAQEEGAVEWEALRMEIFAEVEETIGQEEIVEVIVVDPIKMNERTFLKHIMKVTSI